MRGSLARRALLLAALATLAFQLVIVYSPSGGGAPPFPNFDKLVHCTVFAMPVFLAVLARVPAVPVVALFAVHAPVSELVQWGLLPNRSGDPWDAVADLVGVALGAVAAHLLTRRLNRATAAP